MCSINRKTTIYIDRFTFQGDSGMENKRRFLWQGLLMTGVSLLLRSAGVSAQIIVASKIGAEAVGISALIGGVGGFAVTLALSGIQPGCVRLISQALGKQDHPSARRALLCCVLHALLFGSVAGLLLFVGSGPIGTRWIGDARVVSSLRILALTLPSIALSSCLSGYFVAVRRVYKSAFVQVFEEGFRIGCTVILLNLMAEHGIESALLALAISNALSDIVCAVSLSLLCIHDQRRLFKTGEDHPSFSILHTMKQLLSITLPIAIAAYARSGLITLEHSLIPRQLQLFGMDHAAALSAYGRVQSMALPILLFPCALLWSFAGLLVPEITEAHVRSEKTRIHFIMQRVFSLTLFFAIGASGIMIAFSEELGLVLYQSTEVAQIIRWLAPLIPVMYLDSATDAMLKGLGEQVYSMKVNIIDSLISVLLVWLLLPRFGIYGYIITIYVTELLNAALSILRLLNIGEMSPCLTAWIVKPVGAIVGATCLTRLLYPCLVSPTAPFPGTVGLVVLIITVLFLYVTFLLLLGAIQKKDARWLKSFFYR